MVKFPMNHQRKMDKEPEQEGVWLNDPDLGLDTGIKMNGVQESDRTRTVVRSGAICFLCRPEEGKWDQNLFWI